MTTTQLKAKGLLEKIKLNKGMIDLVDIYIMIDLFIILGGKTHFKTDGNNHNEILYIYNYLLKYIRNTIKNPPLE